MRSWVVETQSFVLNGYYVLCAIGVLRGTLRVVFKGEVDRWATNRCAQWVLPFIVCNISELSVSQRVVFNCGLGSPVAQVLCSMRSE